MISFRVIARLDIKGPHLIKGVRMEGLRKLGDPVEYARRYARQGADELLFMHVASLYGRAQLLEILQAVCEDVFIPITVGGGVASLEDADALLRAGADKVALNSAAIARPQLIRELADHWGCQAIVASIEAKRSGAGWEAYRHFGRERTGLDAVGWAAQCADLGAGEVLWTAVDQDGTRKGPQDVPLSLDVPIVLCGGITAASAARAASCADAIAVGAALHYGESIAQIKTALSAAGRCVRSIDGSVAPDVASAHEEAEHQAAQVVKADAGDGDS